VNAVKISIDERNKGDTILRAEQSRAEQSRAEQSRAEQNYAIDVVKYIMAFCVIAIHTLPLKNVQNEVVTSLFDTFVSLAVPFIFSFKWISCREKMQKKE